MGHLSARTVAFALGFIAAVGACGTDARPPPLSYDDLKADAGAPPIISIDFHEDDGCPPDADAQDVCGNEVIPVVTSQLNLYFVLDRSASMQETLDGSRSSKYDNAYLSIVRLLRTIGHRVHFGAAIFPPALVEAEDACSAGVEVFPSTAGDPACYQKSGEDGPNLTSLRYTLGGVDQNGGTPVSATLQHLSETLFELDGETAVVLATDGAPNCNPAAVCGSDECIPNLEGDSFRSDQGDVACDEDFNCCDPNLTVAGANLNCVDTDGSEAAVQALAEAGVRTYVIGMPGSEAYSSILDALALAGQTARPSQPYYYAVADTEELTQAVLDIGREVAISCEIELESAPPDRDWVNVYADADVLPRDEKEGWSWIDERTIAMNGDACESLKSGNVLQLQVVAGCPTVVY